MLQAKEVAMAEGAEETSADFENRLRLQKLELDETYRGVLDSTKMELYDTKKKFNDAKRDYNNVAKWLLSGEAQLPQQRPPGPPRKRPAHAGPPQPVLLKSGFMLKK